MSDAPPVLVHRGRELAPLERTPTRRARRRGLLGRDRIDTVMVLDVRSVHTIGMRVPIDVAQLDGRGRVLALRTVAPGRVLGPRRGSRRVLEAAAGAFSAWGVRVGDEVELRG